MPIDLLLTITDLNPGENVDNIKINDGRNNHE
jgi:hypothetical protein